MTANDLIPAFDTLADAPGGVKRLRELVLQLAVRGKLVEQDSADGTVVDTLASIKKASLRAGRLPAERVKDFGTLAPEDSPFEPPTSWRMLRFGDVFVDVFTGPFGTSLKAHEYRMGGTPVVNPQNLRNGVIVPTEDTCVGPETLMRLRNFVISDRDIVVARRGEMGRCAVVTPREAGWLCGTGSLVLRPPSGVAPRFVATFLGSPWTVDRLGGDSVGSTMKNLNQKILANLPFGLPPLAEQHRIVARVDELMDLLNRLEAAHTARDEARRAARDAAFAALRDAESTNAVEVAWGRITKQLDVTFVDPEDIGPLRRAVLELAVRGQLVPQEMVDDPISIPLARTRHERTRLIDLRVLRRTEPIDAEYAVPAARLPLGWAWARPDELCALERYALAIGPFGSDLVKSDYREAGVPLVFVREITSETFGGPATKYIEPEKADDLHAHSVHPGDLLITKMGAPPGDTAIYPDGRPAAVITADCIKFRPHRSLCLAPYLKYAYRAPVMRAAMLEITMGIAHQKMSLKRFRSTPVPIPPLSEQRRIVAKVDALMSLCDDLEARLNTARDLHAQFAAAAVHHLDV